jgi:hypothetical protein
VVGAPLLGKLADGTLVVYLTCGGDPNLVVLNASDGEEAIRPETLQAEFTTKFLIIPTGTSIRPIPIFAPPVDAGDAILIGAHEGNDTLYALDRQSLQEKWHFNPTTYEQQQQQQQQQQNGEQPKSLFDSPLMNIALMITVAMLMFTLLGRRRQQ